MTSLERFLVERTAIAAADIEKAQRLTDERGGRVVDQLRRLSVVEGRTLAQAIAQYFNVPVMRREDWPAEPVLPGALARNYLREHKILPIAITDGVLVLAVADPGHSQAIDAVRLAADMPVSLRVASAEEIEAAVDRLAADEMVTEEVVSAAGGADQDDDVEHLKDMALGAPVVRIVNQLLLDALHTRATDIHIEPTRNRLVIRQRIDGMLREVRSPPAELARAVVSRVKILSGLDIAERRLPQDGRARVKVEGRTIDLRIATMPTINGESVAIRLLENTQRVLELGKLGFAEREQALLQRHLAAPYGLILVTGPTGSGKTTTLATALTILNDPTRKILTIEDPIEYQLDGVNQTQIKPEIGVTFAHALRSFLRHDPDVIMVGEMRDSETAQIAVQAALTGHLVLSTLHTNSAAGAVTRLLDMGVDAFLLASSLRCVIGQRLVRVLCSDCRKPVETPIDLPAEILLRAGIEPGKPVAHWAPGGCDRCSGTGYLGRISIIEMLHVSEPVQRLIRPDVNVHELTSAAVAEGLDIMAVDGLRKCLAGLTTPSEVRRVALEV